MYINVNDKVLFVKIRYYATTVSKTKRSGNTEITKSETSVTTEASVQLKDSEVYRGSSKSSPKDNFSRKSGRKLAVSRALSQINEDLLSKEERKLFWEEFFKTCKQ